MILSLHDACARTRRKLHGLSIRIIRTKLPRIEAATAALGQRARMELAQFSTGRSRSLRTAAIRSAGSLRESVVLSRASWCQLQRAPLGK